MGRCFASTAFCLLTTVSIAPKHQEQSTSTSSSIMAHTAIIHSWYFYVGVGRTGFFFQWSAYIFSFRFPCEKRKRPKEQQSINPFSIWFWKWPFEICHSNTTSISWTPPLSTALTSTKKNDPLQALTAIIANNDAWSLPKTCLPRVEITLIFL